MTNLSNEEILKHIDSKYSFVTVVSKRARQLLEGASPLVEKDEEDERALSVALRELTEDKFDFHRMTKEEIEQIKLEKLAAQEAEESKDSESESAE